MIIFEKKIGHGTLLLISLQTLFETFLILRIIPRDIIINVHRHFCKATVILVRFQLNVFLQIF